MSSSLVWDIWAPLVLGSFLTLQVLTLLKGNQLSRWIRRKLGIAPKQWRRFITIPSLWLFLLWFGVHITTPWL